MKYKLFKEIRELDTFGDAVMFGGLPRQPEFSEDHGELFYHAPSGVVILEIPEGDEYDIEVEEDAPKESPNMLKFFAAALLAQPPLNDDAQFARIITPALRQFSDAIPVPPRDEEAQS